MRCIVIGAGIIGCAVAHELAARGASVRVLEMRDVGQGATRASAGVLCPYIEGHAASLLRLGVRSLELYDRFVETARSDSGLPVEYRRSGTLEIALTEEQAATLRAHAARHAAAGVEHQYLDAAATHALEPAISDAVVGSLLVPQHGYVGVAGLTRAIAAAARARGATIETASVRGLEQGTGHVEVIVDSGTLAADAVIVAAGSWSSALRIGPACPPVKPIRGQLLQLAFPVPPASRVIWGADCYLVPWQDGSLLVGATAEDVGFDESATTAGVRGLLEAACELLPAALSARFGEVRVGLRPATSDELPIIGHSSAMPGVIYATGHFRNGVLLAPLTAKLVAGLVLSEAADPDLALTRPGRFGL